MSGVLSSEKSRFINPSITTAAEWPAPEFSNGSNENWYYIAMSFGDAVIQDPGDSRNCSTRLPNATRTSQQWKFVGSADAFTIISRDGNVAVATDYMTMSADAQQASVFSLHRSTHPDFTDCWEVEAVGKSGDRTRLNSSNGFGTGRTIGFYTPGDAGNALCFISAATVAASATVPERESEFAVTGMASYTPANRHTLWYTSPATATDSNNPWMEYALPIGNGQFGAMI